MTAALATVPEPGSQPLPNARHERFAQEYLIDRNGAAAYVRAGYSSKNALVAAAAAARLMTDGNVRDRIAYFEAQRAERVGMTADDVLRELKVLGTSDVRHYRMGPGGTLELADDAPDHAMRAVQSVKVRRRTDEDGNATEEIEYRLWNKPAALRMAGEVHRLFVTKVEQVPVPQQAESGEAVMARLLDAMPRVLVLVGGDQRAAMLKQLRAKEEIVVEGKP